MNAVPPDNGIPRRAQVSLNVARPPMRRIRQTEIRSMVNKNKDSKNEEPWYGAKCVFLHVNIASCPGQVYEERVVLVRANDFDEAIRLAEIEANNYAGDDEDCTFTGFMNVFHIYDKKIGDGTEVYSLMRTSDLD